jgi:hypothetical protein
VKYLWILIGLAACVDAPKAGTSHEKLGTCGAVTTVPIVDSPHVEPGTMIHWASNPPTSGPHYPVWAQYDRTYAQIDRGFWLHNAEHGSIVYAYRCDDGCPEVVNELAAAVKAMPHDPHCTAPVWTRSLVVNDPLLPDDHTIAAVAWGAYYLGTCFDADALAQFAADHYGISTENTCVDGIDLDGVMIQ